MKLSKLTYRLYRALAGESSFWRWEVLQKRRKAPLKSGFAIGTWADAKQQASDAMLQLAAIEKTPPPKKPDHNEQGPLFYEFCLDEAVHTRVKSTGRRDFRVWRKADKSIVLTPDDFSHN